MFGPHLAEKEQAISVHCSNRIWACRTVVDWIKTKKRIDVIHFKCVAFVDNSNRANEEEKYFRLWAIRNVRKLVDTAGIWLFVLFCVKWFSRNSLWTTSWSFTSCRPRWQCAEYCYFFPSSICIFVMEKRMKMIVEELGFRTFELSSNWLRPENEFSICLFRKSFVYFSLLFSLLLIMVGTKTKSKHSNRFLIDILPSFFEVFTNSFELEWLLTQKNIISEKSISCRIASFPFPWHENKTFDFEVANSTIDSLRDYLRSIIEQLNICKNAVDDDVGPLSLEYVVHTFVILVVCDQLTNATKNRKETIHFTANGSASEEERNSPKSTWNKISVFATSQTHVLIAKHRNLKWNENSKTNWKVKRH